MLNIKIVKKIGRVTLHHKGHFTRMLRTIMKKRVFHHQLCRKIAPFYYSIAYTGTPEHILCAGRSESSRAAEKWACPFVGHWITAGDRNFSQHHQLDSQNYYVMGRLLKLFPIVQYLPVIDGNLLSLLAGHLKG